MLGFWQSEEVLELLQSQGWRDLTVLTRKKVQRKPVWIVRGKQTSCARTGAQVLDGCLTLRMQMAPRALRCSSTRPLHALRFLVIALLCRGPSELGKTLPKLPREDKVQLRLQDAVGSPEVGSAPDSTPDSAAGAQGLAATEAVTYSPKRLSWRQMQLPATLCQMKAWAGLRIMRPLMAGDQLIRAERETVASVQLLSETLVALAGLPERGRLAPGTSRPVRPYA